MKNILCGVVYIAPEESRYCNIECFDVIEQDLLQLTEKGDTEICTFGDFNAKSALLNDIFSLADNICISLNMDSSIFQTSYLINKVISLPIRHNKDQKVNNYNYRLIELIQKSNLCIVYRRSRDQRSATFTCKDASVVDYFNITFILC